MRKSAGDQRLSHKLSLLALPAQPSWQAPTLALFLILLAFFIILGQMSQVQGQKFAQMQKSVHKALNGLPLDTYTKSASGGVDSQAQTAVQDIVSSAYTDITTTTQDNWDVVMVRQEKVNNAINITLNAPAVLLDDISPYPPAERLSGVLAQKMLDYETDFFKWQLRVSAAPPQDINAQQQLSLGLARFSRALVSRGLKSEQIDIAFNSQIAKNMVQIYLIPQKVSGL